MYITKKKNNNNFLYLLFSLYICFTCTIIGRFYNFVENIDSKNEELILLF